MPTQPNITISLGEPSDYAALARHHYRAAKPATFALILRALASDDTLVGVLVVSNPALNSRHRALAWPDAPLNKPRYASSTPRASARWINTHVRTITRVIIDPRYRGLGLARSLVRHYLAAPLTTHTDALASMGRWCPFFESAGMRRIDLPPAPRDLRLALVFRALAIAPHELIEVHRAQSTIRASHTLRAALIQWANASKATRRLLNVPDHDLLPRLEQLAVIAASTLTAPPVAYASP